MKQDLPTVHSQEAPLQWTEHSKMPLKFLDSGIIGAVKLTSTNAADELGLTSKGRIEVGRDADLLVVDRI